MDELDASHPVPTAAVPLLEGTRLEWAKRLLGGASYYAMEGLFYKMGEEAEFLPKYISDGAHRWWKGNSRIVKKIDHADAEYRDEGSGDEVGEAAPQADPVDEYNTRTERYLKTAMSDERKRTLFHAIPRDVLTSLCLGTVAYDFHESRRQRRQHYQWVEDKGIYTYGVSVAGRSGKWLTASELEVLIRDMTGYISAYDHWVDNEGWDDETDKDSARFKFVEKIDDFYGHDTLNQGPRYVTSSTNRQGMQDLLKSLQRRVAQSRAVEPLGDIPLMQSPLYVGLSVDIEKRLHKHNPNVGFKSALKNSNKPYALVLSLMKYQGMEPEYSPLCVLRLWEKSDAWFSEVMICALASSLICQDGFNMTECGDPVSSMKSEHDKPVQDYVEARRPFLNENFERSLVDLRQRSAFLAEFEALELGQPDLVKHVNRYGDLVAEAKKMEKAWEDSAKEDRAWEKTSKTLERAREQLNIFSELVGIPDMEDEEDDGSAIV